ncbi:MAG: polysaccharide deacetylase family protein, partial [Thermoleophilia bacterium]|nr:polysaccharide deacetylase family protein [Thermoleophilia bacterium]
PILEERGIPAVAFAVSDRVGGTNDWDRQCGAQTLDLLSADGLQEAAARGVEIGSHTATHPQLPKVPPAQLESELSGSASQLESLGLPRPRAFAYPYGLWNPRLAKAVSDAGYELAFAVERGCVKACSNRHTLPRTAVHSDDTGRRLHLKLTTAGWPRSPREALRMLTRRSRPEPLPAPQPEADLTRRQVSERGRAYNS